RARSQPYGSTEPSPHLVPRECTCVSLLRVSTPVVTQDKPSPSSSARITCSSSFVTSLAHARSSPLFGGYTGSPHTQPGATRHSTTPCTRFSSTRKAEAAFSTTRPQPAPSSTTTSDSSSRTTPSAPLTHSLLERPRGDHGPTRAS